MDGSRTPYPRPHWRHFAVNIISPAILTFTLFLVLIFAVIIPTMKKNIVERKKEMLRELTQAAWSDLAALHAEEQRGALSRSAAQQAAAARVRHLRFGDDGKDYFWIQDLSPRMVMHPYRPDLDGQDLAAYSDPAGKKLFVEFAQTVRERGDGYVEYLWQWKDDETRVVPKLSYVKGFAPWGWVVGTGIYMEDVRAEIDAIIRRALQVSVGISVVIAGLLAYIAKQGLNLERRRWRAETALRGSEEKYRLLVEGTTESILLVMQERPVYANTTLRNRLGYTEQELAQLPLEKIIASLPNGTPDEPATERRAQLLHKNGEVTDVLLTVGPVRIGDRPGQILSIRDVATRKQTEETLARLVADLQSMLPLATRSIKSMPLTLATCGLDTPIHKAVATMARAKTSAILVTGPGGEPIGMVTDQDLRNRVLALARDAAQPVSTIMSAPLVRIADHALLFEAALLDAGTRDPAPGGDRRARRHAGGPDRHGDPPRATTRDRGIARRDPGGAIPRGIEGQPRQAAGVRQGAPGERRPGRERHPDHDHRVRCHPGATHRVGRSRPRPAPGRLCLRRAGQRGAGGANPGHRPGQRHHLRRRRPGANRDGPGVLLAAR